VSTIAREKVTSIIEEWIASGWQKGNDGKMDELLSVNYIDHDPAGRSSGREGFKEGIRRLYHAFPDFYASVEDIIWDEEKSFAAVRWSGKGTHTAEYFGYPPTGKLILFKGIEIIEIKNDLITQRWGEWDGLDIIDQLKDN
jgi:predicted ester cyclase